MDISCPVSEERINENVVRIIAATVLLIGIFCVWSGNYFAIFFLVLDFCVRSFTSGKLSLLRAIAIKLVKIFGIPMKQTDLAPKKFAARMGFFFCVAIVLLLMFQLTSFVMALTVVLICFATLESVFAICVGCHIYSLWQHLYKKNLKSSL